MEKTAIAASVRKYLSFLLIAGRRLLVQSCWSIVALVVAAAFDFHLPVFLEHVLDDRFHGHGWVLNCRCFRLKGLRWRSQYLEFLCRGWNVGLSRNLGRSNIIVLVQLLWNHILINWPQNVRVDLLTAVRFSLSNTLFWLLLHFWMRPRIFELFIHRRLLKFLFDFLFEFKKLLLHIVVNVTRASQRTTGVRNLFLWEGEITYVVAIG